MTSTYSLDSSRRGGPTGSPAHRLPPSWLKLVQEAVEAADFGTIQIKVHGGEVVQIETTRKIRVPSASNHPISHPTAHTEEP